MPYQVSEYSGYDDGHQPECDYCRGFIHFTGSNESAVMLHATERPFTYGVRVMFNGMYGVRALYDAAVFTFTLMFS